MKRILQQYLSLGLLFSAGFAFAEPGRQECLGRLTFDIPEDIEWVALNPDIITNDHGASYEYDNEINIRVSRPTTLEQFHFSIMGVSRGNSEQSGVYQQKRIADEEAWLATLIAKADTNPEHIANQKTHIEKLKRELEQIEPIPQYDLGLPNAFLQGNGIDEPVQLLLWRGQRIYYFYFKRMGEDAPQRAKDLIARFQPRDLYEVPEGPGFCFPYGFITDDGKTAYSIRNSLRFTRTPNVSIRLVNVSLNSLWQPKPTIGLYDTDFYPGYDASKWKKTNFIERTYIGDRLAGFEGWRLDPKPGSGEQERTWFGLAHTGGKLKPLVAVQVFTFKKGDRELTDFTPPPEELMSSLKELTKSIKQTLGK